MAVSTLSDLTIMTVSSAFGTGSTIPLGSAAAIGGVTFLSFSGAGVSGGTTVSYSIQDPVNGGSEIGQAVYTSSNTTLTSRTPTKSTNGNAAITASSGALIYGAARAEDLNPFIVAGQLLGTATNDSANAGNVGEYISATVGSSIAISLTTGQNTTITSIGLAAGDWDISGTTGFLPGTGTVITRYGGGIETSSSVLSFSPGTGGWVSNASQTLTSPGITVVEPTGMVRASLASSATYFLNVVAVFTTSTLAGYGIIRARRVR